MQKNNLLVKLSVWAIKQIWHGKVGRWHNNKKNIICRFYPSCSNYTIMALQKHGFWKGWLMAYKRIKSCTVTNTDSCIDYP